jgi:hypothetical protein
MCNDDDDVTLEPIFTSTIPDSDELEEIYRERIALI